MLRVRVGTKGEDVGKVLGVLRTKQLLHEGPDKTGVCEKMHQVWEGSQNTCKAIFNYNTSVMSVFL